MKKLLCLFVMGIWLLAGCSPGVVSSGARTGAQFGDEILKSSQYVDELLTGLIKSQDEMVGFLGRSGDEVLGSIGGGSDEFQSLQRQVLDSAADLAGLGNSLDDLRPPPGSAYLDDFENLLLKYSRAEAYATSLQREYSAIDETITRLAGLADESFDDFDEFFLKSFLSELACKNYDKLIFEGRVLSMDEVYSYFDQKSIDQLLNLILPLEINQIYADLKEINDYVQDIAEGSTPGEIYVRQRFEQECQRFLR